MIDIVSIGAGGGSIAWIDELGAVRVGPQSAGASPGPACFGLGGTEPTVTDCHLMLGRLDPENFLGGRMRLDVAAAEEALQSRIAGPLGLGLEEAAAGVLAIAETNMVFAIRAVTVERGLDPREFVVFSYGGGGGLFAAAVAEELEMPAVVVPRAPANFSAWGILTSDYREDVAVTTVRPLDESSAAEAAAILRQLAEEAAANLERYGFTEGQVERIYRADIRYAGQDHAITVSLEPEWLDDHPALLAGARQRFAAAHIQLYGHGTLDPPLELVTSRARAVGHIARPSVSEPATLEQVPPQRVPAGVLRRSRPGRDPCPPARDVRFSVRPGDRRGVGDDSRRAARLVGARRPAREPAAPERALMAIDVFTAEIVRNALASASLEMNKTLGAPRTTRCSTTCRTSGSGSSPPTACSGAKRRGSRCSSARSRTRSRPGWRSTGGTASAKATC